MKPQYFMRYLLALLATLAFTHAAGAQTSSDPNEGSRLTYDSQLGTYEFSWWGQPGRTYFIQHSDDLTSWEYLTLIDSGGNDMLTWSFTSSADRFFLRLRLSDIPTSDPFNADFDGDKVSNYNELGAGTDPLVSLDSEPDGLPDDWERFYFGNLAPGADDDLDEDGLLNSEEFLHGTRPYISDSDYDGLSDGDEVNIHHTDPLKWDTDDDLMPDAWEVLHGLLPLANDAAGDSDTDGLTNFEEYSHDTDPQLADTDGDGLSDGDEVHIHNTYPTDTDTDDDGLADGAEIAASADPNDPDSDDDGANDGEEVDSGTNPNSDQSHPPVWRVIYRTLQYDFDDYPANQGGRRGWLTTSGSWPGSGGGTVTLSTEIAWPALSGRLASEVAFPVTKPAITGGLTSTYGYAGLIPNPPCYHATLLHARVWLEVKPAATEPVTRKLPKVTERSSDGQSSAPAVEMVEITIPAGQSLSPPTDLTPTFTTNPAGNQSHSESVKQSLLPLEIQVKRPQNLSGDWAKSGKVIDNLLSVWDTHDNGKDWIQAKVVLPESFVQNLPPNFIKWTVEGVSTPIADNTLETPKLRWPGQTGVKKITIDFPMARLRKFLYVDLPHVGHLSWDDVKSGFRSQGVKGYLRLVKILGYSDIATDWSESQTSLKPSERNALKHAAWMSLCASDIGLGAGYAKLVGDGYEYRDKDTNQPASESTMDLHNNEVGRGVIHTGGEGTAERHLIFQELLQKLEAGELWIWDGNGDEHGPDSLDLIIKSNEQKLYPSEETY